MQPTSLTRSCGHVWSQSPRVWGQCLRSRAACQRDEGSTHAEDMAPRGAVRSGGVHLLCAVLGIACLCRPNYSNEGEHSCRHVASPRLRGPVPSAQTHPTACLALSTDCRLCLAWCCALRTRSSVPLAVDPRSQDDNDNVLRVHAAARLQRPVLQERQASWQTNARVSD